MPGRSPLPDPAAVQKILVCQLRQLGDVLLATPAIRLLAERFPRAEIHVLTGAAAAPLLEGNPRVARVWVVPRGSGLGRDLALAWRVASERFDLLVDFQQLPRIRWVAALSRLFGTRARLSFDPPWYNRRLYSHWTTPRDGYAAMSKASVLAPLGIKWSGEPPELFLTPEEIAGAVELLREAGIPAGAPFLTVDPTHRRPTRRWPAESFGRLLALAAEKLPGGAFLVLWGPGEEAEAREVARLGGPACRVPARLMSLREMAAVIAQARLHLGTCSAPRHIAVAVGTPSLTVLGSTSPAWTFPGPGHAHVALGLPCQPCNRNECPDPRCLTELTPETVLPALLRAWDEAHS